MPRNCNSNIQGLPIFLGLNCFWDTSFIYQMPAFPATSHLPKGLHPDLPLAQLYMLLSPLCSPLSWVLLFQDSQISNLICSNSDLNVLALPQYICTSEGNFEIFIYAFSPCLFPLVLSALKLDSEVEPYSPGEGMVQRNTERRKNFTEFLSRLNNGTTLNSRSNCHKISEC